MFKNANTRCVNEQTIGLSLANNFGVPGNDFDVGRNGRITDRFDNSDELGYGHAVLNNKTQR